MRLHTREDSGLQLDRELHWWHDGQPVQHPRIIEAFNRGLRVDEHGRYVLEFGNDWCVVQVAEAAYGVLAVDVVEPDGLQLRLTDRTAEVLKPSTLTVGADGVLLAEVKQGRARARFSRDAQFALGSLLEATEQGPVLRVGSKLTPVPRALL